MLVDVTARHLMFSFMDDVSNCNHIKIHPLNAGKTGFGTPMGKFCYTVPVRPKNDGAT